MAKKTPAKKSAPPAGEKPDPQSPGADAPPAEKQAAKKQPAEKQDKTKPEEVTIVLRRDTDLGSQGDPIAQITLAPGVSLNYLVDAVRCDIAGRDKNGDTDSAA